MLHCRDMDFGPGTPPGRGGIPRTMAVNPIEMQKALGGVNYPASKDEIVDQASKHKAGQEVMKALDSLPDKEYDSPAAVNKEVAKGD
ncbi:hypothetical protein GCM10010393_27300 [Streptomyces gobitricini]|uniref:DUF2795 domain-containing protein n=2 Tax=Streptomyces gobitricini TaxID=68211 RepID=A0ABN3M110_9ACTN